MKKGLRSLHAHYVVRLQGSASVCGWRPLGIVGRLESPKSPAHAGNAAKAKNLSHKQLKEVTSQKLIGTPWGPSCPVQRGVSLGHLQKSDFYYRACKLKGLAESMHREVAGSPSRHNLTQSGSAILRHLPAQLQLFCLT